MGAVFSVFSLQRPFVLSNKTVVVGRQAQGANGFKLGDGTTTILLEENGAPCPENSSTANLPFWAPPSSLSFRPARSLHSMTNSLAGLSLFVVS